MCWSLLGGQTWQCSISEYKNPMPEAGFFQFGDIEKLAIFSKKIEKLANLQQGKKKPKIVLS